MARNRHADKTIKNQLRMRRHYTKVAKDAEKHLKSLRLGLQAEIGAILSGSKGGSVVEMRRAMRVVDEMVADNYKVLDALVVDRMSDVYQKELDFSVKSLGVKKAVGISEKQIRSLVMTDPFDGKILKEWIAEQSLQTQNKIKRAIRTGIATGVARKDIAAQLINDDLFSGSIANAKTLVRTAGVHFTAQADIKAFEDTGFKKYQLSAVLDTRTTTLCASLDGEVFDVSDPERLIPPFHPGCRTIMIPFEGDDEPIKENYEQWLTKQSPEDQVEALGETRHKLWMSGEPLGSFVDSKSLTIKRVSDI